MTHVIPVERRSAVLTPSRLACLAHVPTINLTAAPATFPAVGHRRSTVTNRDFFRRNSRAGALHFGPHTKAQPAIAAKCTEGDTALS